MNQHSMSNGHPLYDIQKTFWENLESPFPVGHKHHGLIRKESYHQMGRFLDYPLTTPIGVSACAITTARGIKPLAKLGFGVLTYKTIRSRAHTGYPMPQVVYLNEKQPALQASDIGQMIQASATPPTAADHISISNSLGNPASDPEWTQWDIATAKQALSQGQVLIVSVYGEAQAGRSLLADFVYTAQLAEEAGADVIELNLSCPNLSPSNEPLYHHTDIVCTLIQQIVRVVRKPIIAKIGWLEQSTQMVSLLHAIARGGAQGVAAINSINMQVFNRAGKAVFDQRTQSGVSGQVIRPLALDFVKQLAHINQRERFNLTLLGMGGVTRPEHFTALHQAGAHVALSATGVMWNPNLAIQYHQTLSQAL